MCGRAAQSIRVVKDAEVLLNQAHSSSSSRKTSNQQVSDTEDNVISPNLSPGMGSFVLLKDESAKEVCRKEKVWGLVPRGGTKSTPLEEGPSKHFANLMFNARSETLYEKKTFQTLVDQGKTCIWAVDGYYEWKQSEKNVLASESERKKKQPYFVHRETMPVFIAGLYTKVATGRQIQVHREDGSITQEEEELETFTSLTIDAHKSLQWLHHRQPLFIWNLDLALEWIHAPKPDTLKQIMIDSHKDSFPNSATVIDENGTGCLKCHPVKKEMSNSQYQDLDCMNEVKIHVVPSIKSFFNKSTGKSSTKIESTTTAKACARRKLEVSSTSTSPNKKAKKGTIHHFFQKR